MYCFLCIQSYENKRVLWGRNILFVFPKMNCFIIIIQCIIDDLPIHLYIFVIKVGNIYLSPYALFISIDLCIDVYMCIIILKSRFVLIAIQRFS